MSTLVSKNVQIGADGTASNNFTIYQPTSPDGTLRIGNGNTGTTSAQVVLTSAGNVGIGTSSPAGVVGTGRTLAVSNAGHATISVQAVDGGNDRNATIEILASGNGGSTADLVFGDTDTTPGTPSPLRFLSRHSGTTTERARIDSSGNLLVGQSSTTFPGDNNNTTGLALNANGRFFASAATDHNFNKTADGLLIAFRSAGVAEGNISISGTTTSYNGGHLARWAQTTTAKDESLVKGTVLSNLDEMNVYVDADGTPVENEQLNKVKVSDVEGDANVAGVFVNWQHDEAHDVDEINMAMTGDMIIRIAQGTTVQRGDLLMSAGDGTAKPQGDDIVRAKTIAKVTSTHVTCTYADGSFCVPCVLMAC
jgi:hypothetical protein